MLTYGRQLRPWICIVHLHKHEITAGSMTLLKYTTTQQTKAWMTVWVVITAHINIRLFSWITFIIQQFRNSGLLLVCNCVSVLHGFQWNLECWLFCSVLEVIDLQRVPWATLGEMFWVTIQLGVMLQQYRATKFSRMTVVRKAFRESKPLALKTAAPVSTIFLHPWSPRCNSSSYG